MKPNKKFINTWGKKSLLIFGFGREGQSTYRFFRKYFPTKQLFIADQKQLDNFSCTIQKQLKQDANISLFFGSNYHKCLNHNYDLICKTPGIPNTNKFIEQLIKKSNLTSHTQIFFDLLRQNKDNAPTIIGITGTKGKSTTASLCHHILKKADLETILVGNIGKPALDYIDSITSKSNIVIELSSHQLQNLKSSPDIAVVLEIGSEHLDYYDSILEYQKAKQSISKYQKVYNYIIYNPTFEATRETASLSPAKHIKVNLQKTNDIQVYIKDHCLIYNHIKSKPEEICNLDNIKLRGKHNLYNIIYSVAVAKLLNIKNSYIQQALLTFKPLKHRLQLVDQINNVIFYNDSLATTPKATTFALQSFNNKPIALIAGGYERNQDFSILAQQILKSNIKSLILMPTTGQRLLKTLKKLHRNKKSKKPSLKHHFAHDMKSAVELAYQDMKNYNKAVILLSPASASFNAFKNYADRGNQFIQAVETLKSDQ